MEHQMTNYQAGGQDVSARKRLEWSVGFVCLFFHLKLYRVTHYQKVFEDPKFCSYIFAL